MRARVIKMDRRLGGNRRRGPYMKNSRTTQHRLKKQRLSCAKTQDKCSCDYHDYDEDCKCVFHSTDSSSCSCEFHSESHDSTSDQTPDVYMNESEAEDNLTLKSTEDPCHLLESHESTSDQTPDVYMNESEAEDNLTLKSAEDPSHLLEEGLSSGFLWTEVENEAREKWNWKPCKKEQSALSLNDDHNSMLNCNDVEICRLDRYRNEDSYSDSAGDSESLDDEPSSGDETENGVSDGDESNDNEGGDSEGDDPDGDDPGGDDPGGDDDVDANDSNANDILDGNNFSLDHPSLNRVLETAEGRTAKEVLAMNLTVAMKQNLNHVTLVELCRINNVTNAFKALPNTKKQLWAVLQKNSAGIQKHAYCEDCSSVLGELKNLPRVVECNNERCEYTSPRRNVKYFITVSLKKQLKSLLSLPGIRQHLQYKNTRRKLNPEAREDVFDGDGYKALEEKEDGLREFDLTCELNTDGFSTSKSSNSQGWAILGRINELPPALRQKLTFLVALIIADGEADLTMLFQPFVEELNDLSRNGIRWNENGQEFTSRVFPTCFCLDARARAILLNLNLYNGRFSCPFCLHCGVKLAGCIRFPEPGTEVVVERRGEEHVIVIPDAPLRTDAGVRADMENATVNRKVNGFHGPSVLINLNHFDFAIGCSTDDLHPIFIGVTKFLTNLIIDSAANVEELLAQIDGRLLGILTPTLISRKPRSIRKRGKYKGTEWRNWLLYFGVLCMNGLISNANMRLFSLLSKAVFLLSRDSITDNDIDIAEECLQRFVTTFQGIYGPEKMRFNVHIMLHLAQAVRNWGGLHLHSTFPFESWNRRLRNNISSPHGAADQVVDRYLLESLVHKLPFDEELHEEVREELKNISSSYVLINPLKIGDVYFFGKRAPPRPPTEDETLLLNNQNLNCCLLTEYYQCKKSRMLIHSTQHYVLAQRTSKSNNSIILTTDNSFCVVDKIVVFEEDGEQKCGLFGHQLEVGNALNGASHIKEVRNESDAIQWISFDNVRIFALKMQLRGHSYVVPMSNMSEID